MTNLFSTFDPQSWLSLSLNWSSALICLFVLPPLFWIMGNQPKIIFLLIIKRVKIEFSAILSPNSAPGFLLVPLSLFRFILVNNAFGLLPYVFTASSHLSFTIRIALPLWIGHIVFASLKTPTSILAHLVPLGTPVALIPFMVLIELIRRIIRPLTLSVRLAANIIAGHLLLTLLANNGPARSFTLMSVILMSLILLAILECAVRIIQAYVFRVLSTLYLNEVNSSMLS